MEIAAVGRDDFVQGFKLVGVRRAVASSKEDIEKKIAEVLEDPAVGILVLSTADMKGLSHSMRRRLETVARPVVIAVGAAEDEDLRTKVQRALPVLQQVMGDFILRGVRAPGLSREKEWDFKPAVEEGETVKGGKVLGAVQEAKNLEHRVLVPPDMSGKVARVRAGKMKVDDVVVELDGGRKLTMKQDWPVRQPRPTKERLIPTVPLITGQRVMDFLFPIAKGGTAAIPGGFGTGKTVSEQQLSKWGDAQGDV